MSLAEAYDVHLGFWTNWSQGKIQGATLTLTRREGGLLVAFLAIFVGAAGKSFWRVACFILHRMLSDPKPQDGIHHQLQAILRNSDTAQDAAWSLSQILWAWRVPARFRRPFPRLIGIIALALVISISFGVAGVFSSQITTDTANEVLLKGGNCGPLDSMDETDYDGYTNLFLPFQNKRVIAYSNYALQCYGGNISAGAEDCHPYIKAKLKTTVNRNAPCPFSPEMCKSQDQNLIIDTGLLDSQTDLGLNTAPENRFQMRLHHQCAPIVTKGFSEEKNTNETDGAIMQYFYGPLTHGLPNETYTQQMPTLAELRNVERDDRPLRAIPRADYKINVIKSYGGPPRLEKFGHFKPIQQLKRRDADVMLFFLSSPGVYFANQVEDPWFSAHRPGAEFFTVVNETNKRMTYLQDEPVGVMGCTMQTQFCNPNLPEAKRCAPLSGYADDSFNITDLYETTAQKKMFKWAVHAIQLGFFSISGIVDALGVSALVARQALANNNQGPIPNNQWQLEVEHWVSASLASVQGSLVETGNGPTPFYQRFRVPPNGTEEQQMCQSQKIMTTKYSSFSVLGVGLILVLGGLIMFLDLALEPIMDYFQIRRNKTRPNPSGTYARLEWNANATLQLQRLAHEHIGVGTWRYNGWWSHPVTEPGEKLGTIDARNEDRVLLVAPRDLEAQLPKTPSSGVSSWDERTVKKVESFESNFSEKGVKRVETSDTIGSAIIRKGPMRADTKSTLVNEIEMNDGLVSPLEDMKVPGVPRKYIDSDDGKG